MILFFFGEDTFSLAKELQELKAKFASIEAVELSAEISDQALRLWLQEVLEARSLFGGEKFVIFQNFLNEINKYPGAGEYLINFLQSKNNSPLPPLILRGGEGELLSVVFVQTEAPDKRLKFFKLIQKTAEVREFIIPTGKDLFAWVKNWLKHEDFSIEADALSEFVRRLGEGYTLWQIQGELRKLILYSAAEKVITLDTVRKLVPQSVSQNIFDLTNLVAESRIGEAVKLLEHMVSSSAADSKTQVIQIVGALASQIRSLLLVKELEQYASGKIAEILDWKEGRVWINAKLAKKFEKPKLMRLLQDLKAIDFRLKTSEEPAKLLLTLFFQKAGAK